LAEDRYKADENIAVLSVGGEVLGRDERGKVENYQSRLLITRVSDNVGDVK
jgi:hypothetical protein